MGVAVGTALNRGLGSNSWVAMFAILKVLRVVRRDEVTALEMVRHSEREPH